MKMTDEHKAALLAGRIAAKNVSNDFSMANFKEKEKQELKTVSECLSPAVGIFRKAFSGDSKSAAIKARCIQCSCYQQPEITKCKVVDCALWRYRPYQGGATDGDHEQG